MDYTFELVEDLMIADIGGQRLVIDTGAPVSFANASIELMGQVHEVVDNFMGHAVGYFADKLNTRLDGLLAADLMNDFDVTVDYRRQLISFSADLIVHKDAGYDLQSVMGLPYLVDIECEGFTTTCYLDTGASVSYLELPEGYGFELLGHFEDFNPVFGEFSTDLHACELSLGGRRFQAKVGQLPETASALLGMMGVEGILGSDLFKAYRATISARRQKLFLEPHSQPVAHDVWANYYDRVNQLSFGVLLDDMTERTLDFVDELLEGAGSILDAGAGIGRLSIPLCQAGYDVQALDASQSMLEQLRENVPDCDNLQTAHTRLQDYQPVSAFDLVLCVHTVTAYIVDDADMDAVAGMFSRALIAGGHLLIDVAFSHLFVDHSHKAPGFFRKIHFEPLGEQRYRYEEQTALQGEGGFAYQDSFELRDWSTVAVIEIFARHGLKLKQDLTDQFEGYGHHYLLFQKS